jgi:hypothetical protein
LSTAFSDFPNYFIADCTMKFSSSVLKSIW